MPLHYSIPYGEAPAWCFPVSEVSIYLFFLFCLSHAIKQGKRDVVYLFGGLAFGLVLEFIEVHAGQSYTYGRFMVMFGTAPLDIPLCVGVGWGIIIYTARLFSDRLGLGLWACAALDVLLAVNIDMSMDTVAYRLHMWTWNWAGTNLNPLTANWFGVPWGNFCGWQMVVFFYSAFSRLFERKIMHGKNWLVKYILVAVLALLCSQVLLYTIETYVNGFLYNQLHITSSERFAGGMVIFFMIVGYGWNKRKTPVKKIPAVALWVPGWFHLYFFASLFICGFYRENKWLTLAASINLLIGIFIHVFPLTRRRQEYVI